MRIKSIKKMTLLSALCGAGIVIASGYGIAGNGNSGKSGDNGGGAGNSASGAGQPEASGRGGTASSLRKLNGVIHSNDIALEKASDRSIQGYARAYRDAANGLSALQGELEILKGELAALQRIRTDSDLAGLISAKEAGIAAMTAEIATLEGDRDEAWENLTGGRELTEEALAVLEAKLGIE